MSSSPSPSPLTVIVLAAGAGTRMRSLTTPKVLHAFGGRSLLGHVLAATVPLGAAATVVVVGHAHEQVSEHLAEIAPAALSVVQPEQWGTGHAVRTALDALTDSGDVVLVVPGDTPLLRPETLLALIEHHRATGAAATLLTSRLADPEGYGRVIRTVDGAVAEVVEHADASAEQRLIDEVSSGVYVFDAELLDAAVRRLSRDNAQGEEYLPEVLTVLSADGHPVQAVVAPEAETAGVNDRVQLAEAYRVFNQRVVTDHMRAGVTVLDPATTWIDSGVQIEADAVIEPGCQLRGDTRVAAGAVIGPQSTLTDMVVGAGAVLNRVVAMKAVVGSGVTVGPFAYLRPGTELAADVHIGTFVELKNAEIGEGTKVPHLTYVGDATIGRGSNIGAATVFVNYDGVAKHRSYIGDHVRTGADNMFVAPVTVGDGAYTAAGSIITEDVPPGALAVARARQRNVAGWVERNRAGTASAEASGPAAPPEPAEPSDAATTDADPSDATPIAEG